MGGSGGWRVGLMIRIDPPLSCGGQMDLARGEASGIERGREIPPASPVRVGVLLRIEPPLFGGVGRGLVRRPG